MAWRLFCLMSFAVLLVTVSTTPAGIIIEVPSGAYPTIQAGIDAAGSGDIVLVYPGMYTGDGNRDLNFLGKAITVRSIDPNDPCVVAATVIDCNGTEEDHHQGFLFQNGEEPNSVLEGFTITKAYARPPLFPGGGISLVMSNPTIRQCIITNNSEYDAGGGIGALLSDFTLSHCTITNNSAYMEGAGIHAFESDFTLSHCTIKNNTITYDGSGPAGGGAGIAFLQSSPKIEHCIISDNSGANVGGGIYCYIMSSPIITHCIITGNSANDKGGGIFSYNSIGAVINSCTIVNNCVPPIWESAGGGIYFMRDPNAKISNCIMWDNSATWPAKGSEIALASTFDPGGEHITNLTVSYSNIKGGCTAVYFDDSNSILNWEEGNIVADPNFADSLNVDYHLNSEAGRWEPVSESWVQDEVTSPCIDAGNPGCPLGSEPNDVNNVRRNMGAYGGTAEASRSPAGWALLADLTNDHKVDINDLEMFVGYWLNSGACIPSDLNRNKHVDFNDFSIFADEWSGTISCPGPAIEYEISDCDMGSSTVEQSGQTRFSVTVEGGYIHFEDMMTANCCPDELELQMTVGKNQITIYEIEHVTMPCLCICDYPVTARLGPFEPWVYTLDVFEDWGGFIGSTILTLGTPE